MDALLAAQLELDGVLITTPHATHFEHATKAMKAGLHILCEKPMTTDVDEARSLSAAATDHEARGKCFLINNTANWRAQTIAAHDMLAGGGVGRVQHVSCAMHSPLIWLFDDPANGGWVQTTGRMQGNGFGWGQLSHLLAWIFKVTSLTPIEVYALMQHSAASGADMTDAAVIKCEGNASIALSGAATVPGDAHGAEPVGKWVEIKVFGTEGVLAYSGDDQQLSSGRLSLRRRDGANQTVEGFLFENYEPNGEGPESVDAFIRACLGDDYFVGADAQVGLQTVRALDAMYRSARSGRPETAL
jgi:predicted dehydrogenase